MEIDQEAKPLPGWATVVVHLLFFMSGAVALAYEVVWMRMLSFVFGNTTYAVSVVLAAFLGGLAIGAGSFGRVAERRRDLLRIYGLLEAGAAVMALLLPVLLLEIFTPIYTWIYRSAGESILALTVARLLLSGAVLVLPAILMGGTLPVLCRFLAQRTRRMEAHIGRLYGLNTLGAVAGSFLAGFALMPLLGLRWSNATAALVGLWVALAALITHRALGADGSLAPATAPGTTDSGVQGIRQGLLKWVLVAFAVSGFAALAYEVLWMRLLVFLSTGSVYAFSMMLCVYLLGLGLGSLLYSMLISRSSRPLHWFVILEVLIGLSAVATFPIFLALPNLADYLGARTGFWSDVGWMFMVAAAVMIIPTVLIGAVFPLVCGIWARATGRVGRGVGEVYVVNTVGTVLGSFATGFLLIPAIGTPLSLLAAAGLNIFAGLMVWAAVSRHRWQVAAKSVAAVGLPLLLALGLSPTVNMKQLLRGLGTARDAKIEWLREGIDGTVTMERLPNLDDGLSVGMPRVLCINGINVAGTVFALQTTQKLQAQLAMLIHPHPKRVLQIGFGAGGTAYSVSQHPVQRVDCVEVSRAVMDAAPTFSEVNRGVLRDPRVRLYLEDARTFVRHTPHRYDLILSDLVHPMRAGEGFFFSVDYLRDCKRKLAPGGFFSTWTPLHGVQPYDLKVMVRSIQAVFPYVYIWHSSGGNNQFCVIHGMTTPLRVDYRQFARKMQVPGVHQDLAEIGLERPEQVLALLLYDHHAVRRWVADAAQVNTDDNGYLEFIGERRSRQFKARSINLLLTFPAFVSNAGGSMADYLDPPAGASHSIRDSLRREIAANHHVLRGRLYRSGGASIQALMEYRRALAAAPDHFVARSMLGITRRQLDYALSAATGPQATPMWRDKWLAELTAAGRLHEAAQWAEKMRKAHPSEAGPSVVLAVLREQPQELPRLLPGFAAGADRQKLVMGIPRPALQRASEQQHMVARHPADAEAWKSLGDTYMDIMAAIAGQAASNTQDQGSSSLNNFTNQAAAALLQMAAARYQQALSLSPHNPAIQYELARARAIMGDYGAAIALLERMTHPPLDQSGQPISKDSLALTIADLREKERNPFGFLSRLQQEVIRELEASG